MLVLMMFCFHRCDSDDSGSGEAQHSGGAGRRDGEVCGGAGARGR